MPRLPDARHQINRQVGRRIAEERIKRGWSRADLAKAMMLTEDQIGKLERGARGVSPLQLIRLREIFGITIDRLIFGDAPPPLILPSLPRDKLKVTN